MDTFQLRLNFLVGCDAKIYNWGRRMEVNNNCLSVGYSLLSPRLIARRFSRTLKDGDKCIVILMRDICGNGVTDMWSTQARELFYFTRNQYDCIKHKMVPIILPDEILNKTSSLYSLIDKAIKTILDEFNLNIAHSRDRQKLFRFSEHINKARNEVAGLEENLDALNLARFDRLVKLAENIEIERGNRYL